MMKRSYLVSILLMILCVVLLNQCTARELTFRGEVMAIQSEEGYPAFLIHTTDGKDLYILTNERTSLHSWLDGTEAEELVSGELEQPVVQVFITTRPSSMDVEVKTYKAYLADQIILLSAVEPDSYSLPDETMLDLRRHDDKRIYQTRDGTAILTEQLPIGPDRIHVGGEISLEALERPARQRIMDWYENRGLLYDLDALIQAAWGAYNVCENKAEFQNDYVHQEISPCASSEDLIWFLTSLITPVDGQMVSESQSCAAFRRDTGEYVPMEDLFSCPVEEIGDRALEAADTVPEDLPDMKQAFTLDNLVFHSDSLAIWFPAGSLPNGEHTHIITAEYSDLTDILHPWAIPTSNEQ